MRTIAAAWTIARKDLRAFFRDRTGMLLTFLLPIVLVTVFGFIMKYAFGGGGGGGMPRTTVWVTDLDGTETSARFVAILRDSEMLSVRPRSGETPKDAAGLRAFVADGEAHHGLIIETGFERAIRTGAIPSLTVIRDPGRALEDQMIRIGMSQAVMAVSEGRLWPAAIGRIMEQMGMDEDRVSSLVAAARSVQTMISSFSVQPEADNREVAAEPGENDSGGSAGFDFMSLMDQMVRVENEDVAPPDRPKTLSYQLAQSVSGMTVMMLLFGLMACSTTLLYERDSGTLDRLLVSATPRNSILLAKFLFSGMIGMLQLTVLFAYGDLVFSIDAFRDPITLFMVSITWAAAATSFGMLIAGWARTAKQAEGLSTLLILVMAAVGGCWFPIQLMDLPTAAEIVTRCTLTYWAMVGYQGMFWEQRAWTHPQSLTAIGVLWAFVVVAGLIATRLFHRRYVGRRSAA